MPERFSNRILSHLADTRYEPRTTRELATDLQIDDEDFNIFERAIQELVEEKRIVLNPSDTIGLPPPGRTMTGTFRKHERGFGFLVPDELYEHGDLFIPPGKTGDAMTGDKVTAKVVRENRRGGGDKSPYTGRITEVLQRADKHYVGTLVKKDNDWVVEVDGRVLHHPVLIRDPHAKNAKPGDKVVIDLVEYPSDGERGEGVILEVLGEGGEPDVETLSVIRAYGLSEEFSQAVVDEARNASKRLPKDGEPEEGREDLRDVFTLTIDPPDAKDFDDAISLRKLDPKEEDDGAAWELGVHIADVAHYIDPGSAIDLEAYERGNSTYLPRKVIPMLPELLSNGVCSLQPDVPRYTRSVFIGYDAKGRPVGERFARSVIKSDKRLTYLEAQALIDGDVREARKHAKDEAKYPRELVQALKGMNELAKTIRERRMSEGMIVLGLPEVELIFDDTGRVVDAEPEDDAFTHKLIEMFMVEANEAAARLFVALQVPMIRRIHPDPDAHDVGALRSFARVAGFNIPARPSRKELQELLEAVRGKPAQHAVHLAVLRTLSKAEYSPLEIGHFALASKDYTHFTSPIRRYCDLIVHRGIDAYLMATGYVGAERTKTLGRNVARDGRIPNEERLKEIGRHCSNTERNSEKAERELREYLVLELLTSKVGEDFAGTVTGVIGRGIFIQIDRYLIDGFVSTDDLPGEKKDRWQLNHQTGALVAQRSGKTITIGDRFTVRIASVDLTRRQMELVIVEDDDQNKGKGKKKSGSKKRSRKKSTGNKKKGSANAETNTDGNAKKSRRRRSKSSKGSSGGGSGGGSGGSRGKKS